MIAPSECRKNAQECTRLAREAETSPRRTVLANMARTWEALAGQTERLEALAECDRRRA